MVSDLLTHQLATIRTALKSDQRRGLLAPDADADALAAFLAGTIHSLSLLHRNGVGTDVLRQVVDHALSTLPTANLEVHPPDA